MINLFILPNKNKNNIYIKLFIDSISNENIKIVDTHNNSIWSIFIYVLFDKTKNSNIIHIHWPSVIYGSKYLLKASILLSFNMFLLLILKYILKIKIVWTLHNFYSHDFPHRNIDRIGNKYLSYISDLIVVQQKCINLSSNKYVYIPHGNYINEYGPMVPRDTYLRSKIGINEDDILLISLGSIAPYKLIEKIINSVIKARELNKSIKLLIIGKGEQEYVNRLKKMVNNSSDIYISNTFVEDKDIPKYLSISDYSIFYYDKSEMTSGGIILSLSYGVPVITRKIPGSEMISDKSGYIFNTDDELDQILYRIDSRFDKLPTSDIIDTVRLNTWSLAGSMYVENYLKLFNYNV